MRSAESVLNKLSADSELTDCIVKSFHFLVSLSHGEFRKNIQIDLTLILVHEVQLVCFHGDNVRVAVAKLGSFLVAAFQLLFELVPGFGGKLVRLFCIPQTGFVLAQVYVSVRQIEKRFGDWQLVFVLDQRVFGDIQGRQKVIYAGLNIACPVGKIGHVVVHLVEKPSLGHQIPWYLRFKHRFATLEHFISNFEFRTVNEHLRSLTALANIPSKDLNQLCISGFWIIFLDSFGKVYYGQLQTCTYPS
jgi:hypothetical protein